MFAGASLLFDKFKIQVVLALLLVIAGLFLFYTVRVSMLESDLKKAHERIGSQSVEIATLRTANSQMAKDVQTQNNAIVALKIRQAEETKLAEEAMSVVKKEKNIWKGKYEGLFTATPTGKNECENVFNLLDTYQAVRADETLGVKP